MSRGRLLAGMLAVFAAIPLSGYYDFVHYDANGNALAEKFNLLQLPSKTVTFFVSGSGPVAYTGTDSFPSVVNQIRQATVVWNGVETSDLRVAFGGLYNTSTADNSPGGDVVFEQMPPGVLAYSGPTTCEDTAPVAPCSSQNPQPGDTFIPILRSTMHISQDLTKIPGPSFSETFFLVSVHEMGHALGLQHTFTSSAMSTIATRHTSLSQPISADDIAGISLLYPASGFPVRFGAIAGRVVYADNGSPAHMASVVAIPAAGAAVSALTKPDGTFEIDGIPPGDYYLYVHPLPPTADIIAPLDHNGNAVNPGRPFSAVLYPGVNGAAGATVIAVTAGNVSAGYNLTVNPIAAVPVYDVSIYSYFSDDRVTFNAVHPAYSSQVLGSTTLAASGIGLGSNGKISAGLTVGLLGGSAAIAAPGAYAYASGAYTYLALPLALSPTGATGLQTILFSTPDYLYVLPAAFSVVSALPPYITATGAGANGTVTVAGSMFQPDTQIYFDALPGTVLSRSAATGQIVVDPPVGASNQVATLTAYNSDGQNSMFYQIANPPTYAYRSAPAPSIEISPATLPAGAEAAVNVIGVNTNFAQGRSVFGFGSHDVIVRRTFVVSPTHAIVDVGMPPGAAPVTVQVTALTDFQLAAEPNAFQITPPQAGLPAAVPILFNAIPGQAGSYPGAVISLYGSNLSATNSQSSSATPVVTFCGTAASLLYASPNLINLAIPAGLAPGLCTLLVTDGAETSIPVVVSIDPAAPLIIAVESAAGSAVTGGSPAMAGQTVEVFLSGFAQAGSVVDPSRVTVSVGGVSTQATAVTAGPASSFEVSFVVPAVAPGAQVPLIVYLDGRSSLAAALSVGPFVGN